MNTQVAQDILISARGVGHAFQLFDQTINVLKDINISLRAGATLAIMGPSGSGKTTLLSILAGLIKPSCGEVLLLGHRINAWSDDQIASLRAENCGFVFQNYQILPALTALENVMLPLDIIGKSNKRAAQDLLGRVGLGNRMHHYSQQLSGGEQQRIALARAFINKPKVIFADEPTGSLDRQNAAKILDLMFELNKEYGTAILAVTHDSELGDRMHTRIYL